MTWNIDWFRNGKYSEEPNTYLECDISDSTFDNIVTKIKAFLDKPNSVVFLQEVPYKIKTNNKWGVTACYKKFCKDFSDDEYNIHKNDKFCTRYTVSISKKTDTHIANYKDYNPKNNRTIAMQFNDPANSNTTILGVHMPTGFQKGTDKSKMWDELISFTQSFEAPLILVGDFNAYVDCNDKNTRNKYTALLDSGHMEDVVPSDESTFIGGTPIDHVLIKNCVSYAIKTEIPENFELSDHKYIEISIEIPEQTK